jgi:hypothetical protein
VSKDNTQSVEYQLKKILLALSEEERKIFTAVFRIEREKLFLKQPSVKDDILAEIRKVIK